MNSQDGSQSFQRYSSGSDKPFWLEAYGGRAYTVERVGREPVAINQLLLSIVGGIQPDKLEALYREYRKRWFFGSVSTNLARSGSLKKTLFGS